MTKFTRFIKNFLAVGVMTLAVLGLVSFSPSAIAQRLPSGNTLCPIGGCRIIDGSQVTGQDALPNLARNIASFVAFIIASIAIIFILYGAFIWLTDMEKGAERGRKIITNAVIALVVAVVSFGIVQALINFLASGFNINSSQ
jgi:D-alanyl-lipoteichoic acid acyltransferase DltB (MBOAT superfamily)